MIYSVKRQLTRHLLINLMVMVVVFIFVMGFAIRQVITDYAKSHLQHDIDSLIKSLQQSPNQEWELTEKSIPVVYQRIGSGYYFQIVTPQKTLYSRSVFDFDLPQPSPQTGPLISYRIHGPEDEDLLVLQQQITKQGSTLTLWAAENLSKIEDSVRNYILLALGVALSLLFFMFWTQQRILGNAFTVFDTLKSRIQDIAEDEVSLEDMNIPLEVQPLVNQIQSLANRFRDRLQRTRRAIGNLSHELKRPLQLLSMEAESKGLKNLAEPVEQIHQIIERELRRAKVSGASGTASQVAIRDEVEGLLQVLQRIYPNTLFSLECPVNLKVSLDRDDLLELLGNLIDNAGKFSRHQVKISLLSDRLTLHCHVEDDGPGVAAELVDDIFRAGTRLDESVHGHGLGLSICLDIVNIYRGSIKLDKSDLGGLKVSIALPLHPAS